MSRVCTLGNPCRKGGGGGVLLNSGEKKGAMGVLSILGTQNQSPAVAATVATT